MVQDKKERKSAAESSADDSIESAASNDDYDSDMDDSMLAVEPPHIYFFGAELTKESPEFTWEVSTTSADGNDESILTGDDDDAMKHILKLRQVCLGRGAKPGERNIIELEASAPDGELVTHIIASLTVGVQEMGQLQLDFEGSVPITIRLVEGTGPVCITGNHEMSLEYELEDNGELDATTDNIEELSEAEDIKSPRAAKRQKVSNKKSDKKSAAAASESEDESDEGADPGQEEEEMEEDDQQSDDEEDSPKPKEKKQDVKQKKVMNGGGKAGGKSPKDLMKAKMKAKKQMVKKSKKLSA